MSFAAPWFLYLAGAAAAGVVALHLIARRRPPPFMLPTARFVPERAARATSRTLRPADTALLALRLIFIALVGTGLAQPVIEPARAPLIRVLLLDVSRDVFDVAELRDSAAAYFTAGDAVVLFDEGVREDSPWITDSLPALVQANVSGSLTAAFLGAARAGPIVRERADSVEVVLISPVVSGAVDAATDAVRNQWPGGVRVVRVTGRRGAARLSVELDSRLSAGDPIAASLVLLGAVQGGDSEMVAPVDAAAGATHSVLLLRGDPGAADSTWVRGADTVDPATVPGVGAIDESTRTWPAARTLVVWPRDAASSPRMQRGSVDTIGAVVAGGHAVVATFARALLAGEGRVVARWADGEPAAVERSLGNGCVREVAIPVTPIGDLVLTAAFLHLTDQLLRPCGELAPAMPASDSTVGVIAGTGRPVRSAELTEGSRSSSPTAPWLLGIALLLGLAEPLARRGDGGKP